MNLSDLRAGIEIVGFGVEVTGVAGVAVTKLERVTETALELGSRCSNRVAHGIPAIAAGIRPSDKQH